MSQLRVVLTPLFPVHFNSIESPVSKEGAFAWKKLIAGPYRLSVLSLPAGVYLKSIRLGGQALPDGRLLDFTSGAPQPMELQLSTKSARVAGDVVLAGSDQPISEATVILVPDEPERRGDLAAYLHTSTDASGRFVLQSVPPGGYHAYAVHSVRDNLFMDPMFLQPYADSATAVTVAESGQAHVKLNWKP